MGINECEIPFYNGSSIFTAVYGENSLGLRCHIEIIDEFVRTDKSVITRVFDPMLSDARHQLVVLVRDVVLGCQLRNRVDFVIILLALCRVGIGRKVERVDFGITP